MTPTGQPTPGVPMPSAPASAAKDAVNLPSLFIIILSGLGALLFLSGVFSAIGGGDEQALAMARRQLEQLPPSGLKDMLRGALNMSAGSSRVGGIVENLLFMLLAGFTAWGGLQMRSLKNYGVAVASAILVMIPCSSNCCCCVGLPIGIWALVMLMKPEVKSAFS
jgi:hypothetical protein